MGPIWDRQDPGGPHVGPMNFAIWGTVAERKWPFTRELGHTIQGSLLLTEIK